MKIRQLLSSLFLCIIFIPPAFAEFEVIALGTGGGVYINETTSYLVRDIQDKKFLTLDAGSMSIGLQKAIDAGHFPSVNEEVAYPYTKIEYIFRKHIAGYFISHAHLDHVAELVIHSTNDDKKNIYGLSDTTAALKDHYFNWVVWPNMLDSGKAPHLNVYHLKTVLTNDWFPIDNTSLEGKVFPLSHSGVLSSMILLKNPQNEYVAFFGDTGADSEEKSQYLDNIWTELSPLILNKQLKGIIIETSFTNITPRKFLFGHLTPELLLEELSFLESKTGKKGSLDELHVIISHIKPSDKQKENKKETLKTELINHNTLGVNFHFLEQGDALVLP